MTQEWLPQIHQSDNVERKPWLGPGPVTVTELGRLGAVGADEPNTKKIEEAAGQQRPSQGFVIKAA